MTGWKVGVPYTLQQSVHALYWRQCLDHAACTYVGMCSVHSPQHVPMLECVLCTALIDLCKQCEAPSCSAL